MLSAFARDIRFAARSLRGTRRLTFAAISCVALGTAAATFILSVANAILLQPVPFPDARRLVRVWTVPASGGAVNDVSYLDATDIRTRSQSFDRVEMAVRTRLAVTTKEGSERVRGEAVSPGYFEIIAAKPALGRLFLPAEYEAGAAQRMLISHSLWLRMFGGRADVLGATVRARGNDGEESDQLFTVVGVMPSGFVGTVDTDVSEFWLPVEQYLPRQLLQQRTSRATWVIARLRAGTAVSAAQADVVQIAGALRAEFPEAYENVSFHVEPLGETWRARFRNGLAMLTSAALLLLLIACANVSQLTMARVARHEQEFRIRLALGASKSTLARQLIAESTIVASIGGVIGLGCAAVCVRVFAIAGVFQLPSYVQFRIDGSAMIIAVFVLLATATISSIVPAWISGRLASEQLRGSTRGATLSRGQRRAVNAIVSLQVAVSFVLLFGSTLMLQSYANLLRADVGFATDNILRLAISLDASRYTSADAYLQFAADAKRALLETPGVQGVTFIAGVLPPWNDPNVAIAVKGEPWPQLSAVTAHAVDEHFFRVLSIPLVSGRAIDVQDQPNSQRVSVISRSLARAISPQDEQAVIGTTVDVMRLAGMRTQSTTPTTVVGIAEDVKYQGPLRPRTAEYDLYVPMVQSPGATMSIAIATTGDPDAFRLSAQRKLAALAPTSPLHWVSTMQSELALQYGDARLYAWLTAVFAYAALLLVAIGIYGVLSNSVAGRVQEIGLRMAVGATSVQIVRLVVSDAVRPLLIGLALGGIAALAVSPLARSLIYGVVTTQPLIYIAVGACVLVFGLVASFLPARRASSVNPLVALRGR